MTMMMVIILEVEVTDASSFMSLNEEALYVGMLVVMIRRKCVWSLLYGERRKWSNCCCCCMRKLFLREQTGKKNWSVEPHPTSEMTAFDPGCVLNHLHGRRETGAKGSMTAEKEEVLKKKKKVFVRYVHISKNGSQWNVVVL